MRYLIAPFVAAAFFSINSESYAQQVWCPDDLEPAGVNCVRYTHYPDVSRSRKGPVRVSKNFCQVGPAFKEGSGYVCPFSNPAFNPINLSDK